jgi:hypothetical protein
MSLCLIPKLSEVMDKMDPLVRLRAVTISPIWNLDGKYREIVYNRKAKQGMQMLLGITTDRLVKLWLTLYL